MIYFGKIKQLQEDSHGTDIQSSGLEQVYQIWKWRQSCHGPI